MLTLPIISSFVFTESYLTGTRFSEHEDRGGRKLAKYAVFRSVVSGNVHKNTHNRGNSRL